jgi:chromatin remodeling complex protein RSC6
MASAKKGKAKSAGKKSAAKKGPAKLRGGIAAPVAVTGPLKDLLKKDTMTRAEVTKGIWNYIKKNGLQDTKNRRMINADAALLPIFGGKKQVSMFEMTKLVNKHVK